MWGLYQELIAVQREIYLAFAERIGTFASTGDWQQLAVYLPMGILFRAASDAGPRRGDVGNLSRWVVYIRVPRPGSLTPFVHACHGVGSDRSPVTSADPLRICVASSVSDNEQAKMRDSRGCDRTMHLNVQVQAAHFM